MSRTQGTTGPWRPKCFPAKPEWIGKKIAEARADTDRITHEKKILEGTARSYCDQLMRIRVENARLVSELEKTKKHIDASQGLLENAEGQTRTLEEESKFKTLEIMRLSQELEKVRPKKRPREDDDDDETTRKPRRPRYDLRSRQ